jgi:hypothetical protein
MNIVGSSTEDSFGAPLIPDQGHTIDPCYLSKAGKKTPHIGRFWSLCAGAMKHRLEVMGLGLIDIDSHNCMMFRAHQTPGNFEQKKRCTTLVDNAHLCLLFVRGRAE